MGIIVQKFGGTSVADTDKIKNVASAVIKEKNNGNDVIVVVSAMGHTTDYLVKMANEISSHPNSRELDMLLATGEQVSIALLTMAIQAQGYAAVSMNAMQVGIITECVHSKARIVDIKTNKLKEHLDKGDCGDCGNKQEHILRPLHMPQRSHRRDGEGYPQPPSKGRVNGAQGYNHLILEAHGIREGELIGRRGAHDRRRGQLFRRDADARCHGQVR